MSTVADRINRDVHRISRSQRIANDYAWYKERIDEYDAESSNNVTYNGVSEYKRIKVNCDLFNNIIDLNDFAYVCTPFGADAGELPASMVNRDITSYRIKALLGMELKRPFGYKVLAVNPEATTQREEEETNRIREFVLEQIMKPIRKDAELKYASEEMGGRELTEQEKRQITQQIEQEVSAKTPPQIRRYMERDHQDPSEVLGHQIMEYLIREQDIKRKFNKGWKYALLSAYEIYWVGIINDKPVMKVINPIRFDCDKSPELDFIEDGSWAVAEYRMSPSDVVRTFRLKDKEIDSVYKNHHHYVEQMNYDFDFSRNSDYDKVEENTIRVLHVQFTSLRKIGWLDYLDKNGVLQTKFLVDETYKFNKENGDVSLTWEWIPETHEGYKIGTDIYKNMQAVPGQHKDIDNIYSSKLSYHGAIYDNMNSQPTCPMDRMKGYQYYYNIVMYRLELLLASDKGKKILMNIKAIPESAGIDVEKWQYFFESSPFAWFNPDEEGMNTQDLNTVAKVLDMSLASDINRYIELAMYLEDKCGKCVGITDPVLGQTAISKSVGNNQQDLIQTSNILEPYFDLHNSIKKNVLNSLLNVAKIAYINSDLTVLNYVLDDMSRHTLEVDISLLENSTLGLFVEDSSEAEESKQLIRQLAHAAVQNQAIELSDVLAVIKQKGTQEAEEVLKASEKERQQRMDANAEKERQWKADEAEKERAHEKEVWANEKDNIILKETERRKTEIQKQLIMSAGFSEDKDMDDDGLLDIMEIAKNSTNASIALMKERRENRKLDWQIEDSKAKNELTAKELKIKSMGNPSKK